MILQHRGYYNHPYYVILGKDDYFNTHAFDFQFKFEIPDQAYIGEEDSPDDVLPKGLYCVYALNGCVVFKQQ